MDFEFHTHTQKPHYHLHLCMANKNEQELLQIVKAEKWNWTEVRKACFLKAHLVWINVNYNRIVQSIKKKCALYLDVLKCRQGPCLIVKFIFTSGQRDASVSNVHFLKKKKKKNQRKSEMLILIRNETWFSSKRIRNGGRVP